MEPTALTCWVRAIAARGMYVSLCLLFFVTFVTFVNPPTSKTKDICLDGRNIVITFQSIPTFPPRDDLQISAPDPMIELHVAETPQRSSLLASY